MNKELIDMKATLNAMDTSDNGYIHYDMLFSIPALKVLGGKTADYDDKIASGMKRGDFFIDDRNTGEAIGIGNTVDILGLFYTRLKGFYTTEMVFQTTEALTDNDPIILVDSKTKKSVALCDNYAHLNSEVVNEYGEETISWEGGDDFYVPKGSDKRCIYALIKVDKDFRLVRFYSYRNKFKDIDGIIRKISAKKRTQADTLITLSTEVSKDGTKTNIDIKPNFDKEVPKEMQEIAVKGYTVVKQLLANDFQYWNSKLPKEQQLLEKANVVSEADVQSNLEHNKQNLPKEEEISVSDLPF